RDFGSPGPHRGSFRNVAASSRLTSTRSKLRRVGCLHFAHTPKAGAWFWAAVCSHTNNSLRMHETQRAILAELRSLAPRPPTLYLKGGYGSRLRELGTLRARVPY